jgi:hypothetical protein
MAQLWRFMSTRPNNIARWIGAGAPCGIIIRLCWCSFKLVEGAQKSWRRLDGHTQLPKLILGVKFADGLEVIAGKAAPQPTTAAA